MRLRPSPLGVGLLYMNSLQSLIIAMMIIKK